MARKTRPRPTDAELAILRILWDRGPSTVREVHETLARTHRDSDQVGYTTVLKTMQIMTEKDLVLRDESQRAHVYSARQREEDTQRRLVEDLADRAFDGSASQLVMRALSSRAATPEEIATIRRILDEMSGDDR
jgi:predicted transcriptional regulator